MRLQRPHGRTDSSPPEHRPSDRPTVRPTGFTFHLIPHTHWDREWYLTRAEFQARLVPVLDGVLEQLEQDPAARFLLDGQAILLEDYLAIRPEQEPRLRAQVERGALEIGPWYILSDLLIPSAESLRRNLLEGRRLSERFGRRLEVLYSPDAFGHPAVLPSIAAEFGLSRAVIRRGLGKPGDFYRWEGPGGTALLVHHLPRSGYDGAIGLVSGSDLARAWRPLRQELVERATSPEIAVFLGADHHAMAPNVSRLARRLAALEPGAMVRVSGLGEYFEAVERNPPDAPVIRGALRRSAGYTWDLQDGHSSRARIKRRYANAELRLARLVDPFLGQSAESQPVHGQAWRTLLQCQFHDTLAGTTCDEVQREQELRLHAVDAVSRDLALQAVNARAPGIPSGRESEGRLALWNPVERERSGVVTAQLTFFRNDIVVGAPAGQRGRTGHGSYPFALVTGTGISVPTQVLGVAWGMERRDDLLRYPDQDEVDRVWIGFRGPEIPGLGMLTFGTQPSSAVPPGPNLVQNDNALANPSVAVRIGSGSLALTDVRSGVAFRGLLRLLDEPDQGDLYTFSSRAEPDPGKVLPIAQSVRVNGPLIGAVETRWNMQFRGGMLEARAFVALQADSNLIRVRLDLENRIPNHRLRIGFPVGRGRVIAGATIGVEEPVPPSPPQERFGLLEREVTTHPAHRFVAALRPAGTLAVFAPGFFEYEWTTRGELLITALRATGELSRGDLPERPGHAAWPTPTPEAQEPGRHILHLALAILPPKMNDLPIRLERMWEDAFLPIQSFWRRRVDG